MMAMMVRFILVSVLLVPDSGMVTTGIARQSDNGKPRLERCYLQTELPGHALFDTSGFDVAEDVGAAPPWRIIVC